MTAATLRRKIIDLVGVTTVAIALRLIPLHWSYLPYNPDGFGYVASTETIAASGSIPFASMATDNLGFTGLLTAASMLTGQPALRIAQPLSAIVGGLTAVVGLIVARRIAVELDWKPLQIRLAGITAGLLLAVTGVYLYRTTPTDEQTLGLLLVPFIALAIHRAFVTARFRWIIGATLGVAVLPAVHNLSGLVGAVVVTIMVVLHVTDRNSSNAHIGVVTGLGLLMIIWLYTVGYHLLVRELTGAQIVQTGRITSAPGLLLAWVLLMSIGMAWFTRTSKGLQRGLVLGAIGTALGIFTVNGIVSVYPGTVTTDPLLLAVIVPMVIPVGVAVYTLPVVTKRLERGGSILLGMSGTAIALVGFSLSADLTFPYITMLFRSHLFAYLPLAVIVGLGTAMVFVQRRASVGAVLLVFVIVSASVSAPLVVAGLPLLTYQSITTPAEFEATEFASSSIPGTWTTDDHLRRVASYFDGNATIGSIRTWLQTGGPPPKCPTLAKTSWTTKGAQLYPLHPPTLNETEYTQWIASNNIVYATTADKPLLITPAKSVPNRCKPQQY